MKQEIFAGREEELTVFTNAAARLVSSHKGFLMFVGGSQGMGKTSLLKEMASITNEKDFVSSYGSSSKGDGLYPLGAMEDIVFDLARRGSGRSRIQELFFSRGLPIPGSVCTEDELYQLEEKFNINQSLYGMLTVEPELRRRHAIFDSIYSLLKTIGDDCPLILFLDDMDKSDELLWELIRHLVSFMSEMPLAIVCSYDLTEKAEEEKNALTKIALSSGVDVQNIDLKAFDADTSLEMIRSHYGNNRFDDAFLQRVIEESSGNPMNLNEILITLQCLTAIYQEHGQWVNRPFDESLMGASIENVVFRRLACLSENDIELLEFIAGLPEFFPLTIFSSHRILSYTGRHERDILKVLSRFCENFGLFQVVGGVGNLKFPFLRKAIVAELSDEVALRDNEIVAEGLEEIVNGKISPLTGIIANMYVAAGNYPSALKHLENASRYLHTFSSVSSAITFLHERLAALSCVIQHPHVVQQLAETYSELARSYQLEGDWRKAVLNREGAMPYLAMTQGQTACMRAELSIALNCVDGGRYEDAEKSLESLSVSEFVPPQERVVASLILSRLYNETRRSEKALAVLKQAIAVTDNLREFDDSLIALLLLATGNIWLEREEYLKADRMYSKGAEAAAPGTTVYVDLLCRRAEVALASYANNVAEGFLIEAWDFSEKLSYLEGKADVSERMAELKKESDPLAAIESLRKAYSFLVRLRKSSRLPKVCSRLGIIYRANGDVQKALFFLEKAYSLLEDSSGSELFLQTALAYGELVLSGNKLYDSEKIFKKAGDCARIQNNEKAGAFASFGLGKVFLAQRKADKARECFDEARDYFKKTGMVDRLTMVEKELRLLSL